MATKSISNLVLPGDENIYTFQLPYGICSTAKNKAAKNVSSYSFLLLETGAKISVKFNAENTAANPTLNVNNTGAKNIYYRGEALGSSSYWKANDIVNFIFDGMNWCVEGFFEKDDVYTKNDVNELINNINIVELDNALTQQGKAADAKAVGDKFVTFENEIKTYIDDTFLGGKW